MNKIRKTVSVAITCILLWICVSAMGHICRPVNTDITINAINTFHDMPEDTFEVIAYGSSHVWRGLDPMEMYNEYGIGAYNYGCNWQQLNTTLLFLKDSMRTQKPKVALIETYLVDLFKNNQNIDGEIYYTRAIKESSDKNEYLRQALGKNKERYLAYYMPLCAFHDNWVSLTENSFRWDFSYTYDFKKTMGFVKGDTATKIKIPNYELFEQKELSPNSRIILDEIVKTCSEAGTKIIFYTAPYQGTYSYTKAMRKYAEEKDSVYLNFFELCGEAGIDEGTDFSDAGHLNTSGSRKMADYLGKYIADRYEVTDMRTIEGNIWETAKADPADNLIDEL